MRTGRRLVTLLATAGLVCVALPSAAQLLIVVAEPHVTAPGVHAGATHWAAPAAT